MYYIETGCRRTQRWRFAAATFGGVAWLLLPLMAIAQTQPSKQMQTGPQVRPSPESQSPPSSLSDHQLDAAAKAIRQVSVVKQSYADKLAAAPSSDKARIAGEANDALVKAVTDQGLSVDEYNAIIERARTDATLRQKLVARLRPPTQ
jgi:hypothetical protein